MRRFQRLKYTDRKKIEEMYLCEMTTQEISDKIKKNRATIYYELSRGYTGNLDKNKRPEYSADLAQEKASARRAKHENMVQ